MVHQTLKNLEKQGRTDIALQLLVLLLSPDL